MADVTCEKCDEYYKDPRMLPCLHTFCLQCLEKELEELESQSTLHCPNCKEKVTLSQKGVSELPQDLHKANEAEIARISEKVEDANEYCDNCGRSDDSGRAVAFCIDCDEFLCKICKDRHPKRGKTADHIVITAGERLSKTNEGNTTSKFPQQNMSCPLHKGYSLEVYCKKCEKLICKNCMDFKHYEHRKECNLLEEVAKQEMESLRSSLGNCNGAVASLDKAIAQCKQTMQKVETRKTAVDTAINTSLEKVRTALLAQNEAIRLRKITGLEAQVQEFQRIRDGLSHAFSMITAAQSHSPAQQLSTKKALSERAAELKKEFGGLKVVPSESDTFTTLVASPDTVSKMISLGCISGGAHAASSTCDARYVQRTVIGKQCMLKVVAKDKEGKAFGRGGERVEAKLVLKGSQEPAIVGRTTDHGDGTYSVSVTARSVGKHELHVTIYDNHVKGSPFKYHVLPERKNPYTEMSEQKNISANSFPHDVAVTEEGYLAVAEYGNHTVSLYTEAGQRIHSFGTAGSGGNADGQLSNPSAVAVRGDILYVCDNGEKPVHKFSISKRSFISKFSSKGNGDGQLSSPCGICIDPEGKVFISDQSNNCILVFHDDDSFAYSFPCQNNPKGLTFDLQGRLHVALYGSHCIGVFTPGGKLVTSYGNGTVSSPAGLAIDAAGYIAISEGTNRNSCRLWIYSPDYTLVHTIPVYVPSGQTVQGGGIGCDSDGSFWVGFYHSNNRHCIIKYL